MTVGRSQGNQGSGVPGVHDPGRCGRLVEAGQRVIVETGAGEGSGFSDSDYRNAGAVIVPTHPMHGAQSWSSRSRNRCPGSMASCGPILSFSPTFTLPPNAN